MGGESVLRCVKTERESPTERRQGCACVLMIGWSGTQVQASRPLGNLTEERLDNFRPSNPLASPLFAALYHRLSHRLLSDEFVLHTGLYYYLCFVYQNNGLSIPFSSGTSTISTEIAISCFLLENVSGTESHWVSSLTAP